MKGFVVWTGVLVLAAGSAVAAWPAGLLDDPDAARLAAAKTVRIPVAGCVTASFARAYAVLQSPNLLESVQQAYAAQLPPGENPEFEVRAAGGGRYYYVNKSRERCDIREVWRATDTNTFFQCAFYVTGERFFGRFESLIMVQIRRDPTAVPDVLNYETDVRAWPHCALVRIFLRHMPGIEHYFRKKTAEMRTLISGIFIRLAGSESG